MRAVRKKYRNMAIPREIRDSTPKDDDLVEKEPAEEEKSCLDTWVSMGPY